MNFLRRASPLAVMAIGEMMVLASGGFDLSIGSIVTMVVLVSSLLLSNDPTRTPCPPSLIMLGLGVAIGLDEWPGRQLPEGAVLHRHAGHDAPGEGRGAVLGGRRAQAAT